jgi:hypothetical protein
MRQQLALKLFFLFVFYFSTLQLYGQVRYGLKGGVNLSRGEFDLGKTNYAIRIHGGFFTDISLTSKFYIRPELLFSQKGWKVPDDAFNSNVSVTINYLNLPVVAGYKIFKGMSVLTGPELGLKLSSSRNPPIPVRLPYKSFDFGWAFGCSYLFNERLGIDLRYIHGMRYLSEIELSHLNNIFGTVKDGKNRLIQLSAVYLL